MDPFATSVVVSLLITASLLKLILPPLAVKYVLPDELLILPVSEISVFEAISTWPVLEPINSIPIEWSAFT